MSPTRIKLSAIRIPEFFKAKPPRPDTMARKRFQIQEDGCATGIVLTKGCWLVDGYATYLAALEAGLDEAYCIFDSSFTPSPAYRRPVIHGAALSGSGYANIRMDIKKAARCKPGQIFLAICWKRKSARLFYARGLTVNPISWNQGEYAIIITPFYKKV